VVEVVREDDTLVGGELAERESGPLGRDRRRESDRQRIVDGEVEVHVEELGPQRDRGEVRCEVGDVDAPSQGPVDLGLQLATHLGQVGVLPQVVERAWEAPFARLQRWCVGDRTPAVRGVLGVEGEVDTDVVVGLVLEGGMAGPRCRDHQRRAGGDAVAQRFVHADVGRVARAEVVARDDDELRVDGVSEPFGEGDHGLRR
jgi:hypothetical protein